MASNVESKSGLIASINQFIGELGKFKFDDLAREKALGESFNFSELVPDMKATADHFQRLSGTNLGVLSLSQLKSLNSYADSWVKMQRTINGFTVEQNNPKEARDNIVRNSQKTLDTMESDLTTLVATVLAQAPRNATSDSEAQKELLKSLEEQVSLVDAAKAAVLVAKGAAELDAEATKQAKLAAQAAAIQAGVEIHDTDFKLLADGYMRRSWYSLWALAFFALIFVLLVPGIEIAEPANAPKTIGAFLGHYAKHLAWPIFSLIGIVVTAKLFAAERHNAVINRHRETALRTFRAFYNGTDTKAIKDAVLLQATACVFMPQPSGYSKAPLEVVSLPPNFISAAGNVTNAD